MIVSGRLQFDKLRTALSSGNNEGIARVPIVLQDRNNNLMAAVLTDIDGRYEFTNVPAGIYQLVEAFGSKAAFKATVDWAVNAVAGEPITGGTCPPIDYVDGATCGTHLDCTMQNTRILTVASGTDFLDQDFLNGPVTYTPLEDSLDDGVTVLPGKLNILADYGTFGSFPPGTASNTGAGPLVPYPEIASQFKYVEPITGNSKLTPEDGEYTVQNIMNNSAANLAAGSWWRLADHTAGNETGRFMAVNGYEPGADIFVEKVNVKPNTYYLFSAWIFNLIKLSGDFAEPEFKVVVLDKDGEVLYNHNLGDEIPARLDCPEWKQIGTVLYSGDNSVITIKFVSMGPAGRGNDYCIDDIELHEIEITKYLPVKSVNKPVVEVGEIVTFTVILKNPVNNAFTDVYFKDLMPKELEFAEGTVTVNGTLMPDVDPNKGFIVPDVDGGETLTVTFEAKALEIPNPNPTKNTANIDYDYTPIEGGIPSRFETETNEVEVWIIDGKPCPSCPNPKPCPCCRCCCRPKKCNFIMPFCLWLTCRCW